ncbi:MAG TPA: hypothetical protein VGJ84_16255 [Polyangiaceae bacterium]
MIATGAHVNAACTTVLDIMMGVFPFGPERMRGLTVSGYLDQVLRSFGEAVPAEQDGNGY